MLIYIVIELKDSNAVDWLLFQRLDQFLNKYSSNGIAFVYNLLLAGTSLAMTVMRTIGSDPGTWCWTGTEHTGKASI